MRRSVWAVVALSLVVSACSTDPEADEPSPSEPPSATVEATEPRTPAGQERRTFVSQVGSSSYTGDMSLSASEFYEAGMSLPPDVRRDVALRLLESVDPDEVFDMASETWLRTEAAAAYDALRADPSRVVSAETVRARFGAKWAARS